MLAAQKVESRELPPILRESLYSKSDYVVAYRRMEAQEPEMGGDVNSLRVGEALAQAVRASGLSQLFRFQEEAASKIMGGEDVVIVAPTGSGKTEAFAIPIVGLLEREGAHLRPFSTGASSVRALFIYPTKALGRDQLPRLQRLASPLGISVRVFDGDTSPSERREIVNNPAEIIVTNFDVLHYHMMYGTPFSKLLTGVKHIVVDDVHVYTGTFGANVNFILRRLARMCDSLQVVSASATISNPKEFCEALFSRKVSVVSADRGRRGITHFAMLFPSLRNHRSLVLDLVKKTSSAGYQTLCFSRSHLGAELTAFYGRKAGLKIEVHRAGLPATHRRRIEEMFKTGMLPTIACTPTLELGVDIGTTDAVVSDLVSVTSLTQRTGRAGRRGQENVVLLVLRDDDPMSQYYRNHPEDYFRDAKAGYVDPRNPAIAEYQLLAAALDSPLRIDEFTEFGDIVGGLVAKGLLKRKGSFLLPAYKAARFFLSGFDIRGGGESVDIVMAGRKIGERSMPVALVELHPGAVYFLAGVRYRVTDMKGGPKWTSRVEKLPWDYPYYTRALIEEWPSVTEVHFSRRVFETEVAYCDLLIEKRVVGYVNHLVGEESSKGETVTLESPVEYGFRTKGLVFTAPVPKKTLEHVAEEDKNYVQGSSFHAAEHVTIEGTNMVTGGVGSDMGGLSMGSSGLIFIYDGSLGGNGATRLLYDRLPAAFTRACSILGECSCDSVSGCPRCTYSYRCGNNNNHLHKAGGREVLESIISGQRSGISETVMGEKSLV